MEVAPRPPPLAQEFGGNTIVGGRLPFAVSISCPGTDESPGTRLWPHQQALTSRSRSGSREIGLHSTRSSPDGYPSPAKAGNDRVYALAKPARHGPRAGHIEPIGTRLRNPCVTASNPSSLNSFACVFAQWPAGPRAGEDQPAAARQLHRFFEYRHGARRQRHLCSRFAFMRSAGTVHTAPPNIELIPGGLTDLARPSCVENQKLQRQLGRRACAPGGLDSHKALRHLVVRERGEVVHLDVPRAAGRRRARCQPDRRSGVPGPQPKGRSRICAS